MTIRLGLRLLFAAILLGMLLVTARAGIEQPLWAWQGLVVGPDRWWTIATLADAYCGFLTFYAWVFYKESTVVARIGWFAGIMLLGNIAMSSYVLLQLARWRDGEPAAGLLLRRASVG